MTITRIALTDTDDETVISAPAATQRIRVYTMTGSNAGASETRVDIKDGATVRFSYHMASGGGGFVNNLPGPQYWDLAVGTALKAQLSVAVNAYLTIGYELI